MRINNITLDKYRNYDNVNIEFNESRNIIIGDNAQGKTNLVESIYLCAFAKSFRSNNAADLVKIGENTCKVTAEITSEEVEKKISITINDKGKKMIAKDGKPLKRTAELLNNIVVIIFSPEDLRLIKDSPDKRRNYINREISQIRPKYYEQLHNYNEALRQKNVLLKQLLQERSRGNNKNDEMETMLDIFDSQLSESGYEIIRMRRAFVKMLEEYASEAQYRISNSKEEIEIRIAESVTCDNSNQFKESLNKNRARDIYNGSSTIGPHRDDIEFVINGVDAKKYASQGQQRTIALSLKMAEIKIVRKLLGENPVLLMDDVMSELDIDRQRFLLNEIDNVQLFITSTEINEELKDKLKNSTIFEVKQGKIQKN